MKSFEMKIIGIYLAAGESSRMGSNKLELPVDMNLLGSMAFLSALKSTLDHIIVVSRKEDPLHWLAPFSKKRGWSYIRSQGEGQSSSLKAGVYEAMELKVDAVLIMLADQPLVTRDGLNLLINEYQPGVAFVASTHLGMPKPPILFDKTMFSLLLALEGDRGARNLIRGERMEQGKQIEFDSSYFIDIDTECDYFSLLEG